MNVRSFLLTNNLIEPHELPSSSSEFRIECPTCHNPKKKCYVNALGKGVVCFHCSGKWSWRKFERLYEPPTPQEVALENFVNQCHQTLLNSPQLLEYFQNRGISQQSVEQYKLGYCDTQKLSAPSEIDISVGLAKGDSWILSGRLTIPYLHDGLPITVRGRLTEENAHNGAKYLSLHGSNPGVFLTGPLDTSKSIIGCEGEFDAIVLAQNGIQSIGLAGASNTTILKEWQLPDLYLAFDGDKAGREGFERISKELSQVRRIELPENLDVSEYIQTFGIDSFNKLVERAQLYLYGKEQKDDRFSVIVDRFSDWAFSNGPLLGPCIPWAPRLESAISGWAPGLILLGAEANSGKSCYLVKGLYECAVSDSDCISCYLSLDDTLEEAMLRLVSLHTHLSFEEIRTPRWSFENPNDQSKNRPELLQKFFQKLDELKCIENLVLRDATYGRSLDYIRTFLGNLRARYPDKKIVVFIDSLAKITDSGESPHLVGTGNKTNWKAFLAAELKYLTTLHRICLVIPTDLRKINENRRPLRDDLKDAAELAYEANVILLAYNDLNKNGDQASVYWNDTGDPYPKPVFEINIDKNKLGSYRGHIFYKMYGPWSEFAEMTRDEEYPYYLKAIASQHKKVG